MIDMNYNGWRWQEERRDLLIEAATPFNAAACYAGITPPAEIDYRPWLQIENQASMGSCAGHMTSSILEVCNYIQTGGQAVQLSRMFAYLDGQRECGLLGKDQGSTIEGAIEAAKKNGICQESTYPYPGRYTMEIPDAAWTEAAQHKVRNHSLMESERDVFSFQALGIGGNAFGVPWLERMAATDGVIELADVQQTSRNRLLGMHAIPIIGYTARKLDGRNYYLLANSHGRQWGSNGWAEVSPLAVDWWFRIRCVAIGVSDLEIYGQRQIKSWKGMFSA